MISLPLGLVKPLMILCTLGLVLDSGVRYYFCGWFFFVTVAASKSCPLVLNHLAYSLKQIDSAFQEKPNHSQSIFLALGVSNQVEG